MKFEFVAFRFWKNIKMPVGGVALLQPITSPPVIQFYRQSVGSSHLHLLTAKSSTRTQRINSDYGSEDIVIHLVWISYKQ